MANTVGELNVEIGAKLDKLEKALHKMDKSIQGAGKKAEKSTKTTFGNVAGFIAGAFAVDKIADFTRAIMDVRSEFERYEAVLTNTLGSQAQAKLSLEEIKEMAAQTPFSVQELSGAFVKLTNYGLKPSMEAMRQYGDLASSVGKGFDQLAEAVADATTFEFERLKEFGIKAKKEGDKITFTFKEQATTVDATSKSIEEYMKSLGDLEGVSGSMAAISETLGGRLSNLGDSVDNLLNTLGDTDAFKGGIEALSDMITMIEILARNIKQTGLEIEDSAFMKWWRSMPFHKAYEATIDQIQKAGGYIRWLDNLQQEGNRARIREEVNLEELRKNSISSWQKYFGVVTETTEATEDLVRAQEALITLGKKDIPSILGGDEETSLRKPIDQQLLDTTEALSIMENQLALAAETGNLFGGTLQSAFEASLINGESFFETFGNGLKNMIAQLIAAAAASAILAGILSTIGLGTTGTFGAIFGGGDTGSGLGGGFGGFFKLLGTDLVASTGRTGGQQGRF